MALNGLVVKAKKTSFLLLNCKQTTLPLSVKIGSDLVTRQGVATLLGIKFQENQQWSNQIHGKGRLLSGLNSKLFIIHWMRNHISKTLVLKEHILNLPRKYKTDEAIGKAFGITGQAVYKWRIIRGVKSLRESTTERNCQIKKDFKEGLSVYKLVKKYELCCIWGL